MRQVRGVLFLDYVRMLRSYKARAAELLATDDLVYLQIHIDPETWYPMSIFERLGNAILQIVARGEMFPVQLWGRYSAGQLHNAYPNLLEACDPVETLNRFRVLRDTFFDFPALSVLMLHDDEAQIAISYFMGNPAEEAAATQTMGFFEGLLELAGAKNVRAEFRERAWRGDSRTLLALSWQLPPS
ncbi:MAG: hypothetical protein H0T42_03375 [Deltaproteobacteria bacterium]|nr:hypothetical protein [Deltaproteobacteria bacterium]